MRPFGSIKSRLIALHLIAVLAVSVILPLVLYWRVDATARELHERALREQAVLILGYLHHSPDGAWSLDLPDNIRQLYSPGYARYAFAVLAHSGEVMFSSLADDQPLFRNEPRLDRPSYFDRSVGEARYFGASIPVTINSIPLWIQISQDQAHRDVLIDDIVAEFLPHVGWVTIPFLLVLLGIDLLIFRRTLRPLEEASALAQRIGPGSTDLRLPEERMPGDVLPLVRAVNKALDRLEQGFVAQRAFVADASHELRTPITILRAQVEALSDKDAARELNIDIDGLTRVVNQLMDFAESDTLMIRPTEVADLRQVCTEVASFMAPIALAAAKNIAVTGVTDPIWVYGNGAALFPAVRNLVENAITHTPSGSVVEICLGVDATVAVSDAGPGISPEQRDLIFQRFWRGDRRRAGSAGLGLSIVARIVGAHGGVVEQRDREGGGSTFIIKLRPAMLERGKATAPRRSAEPAEPAGAAPDRRPEGTATLAEADDNISRGTEASTT